MLVRATDLGDGNRQHALSFMDYGELLLNLECMRKDHLLLLTDNPTNRCAPQFSASASSSGSGIADRFITRVIADAYKKAGQTAQLSQPKFKDTKTQHQNPASQPKSRKMRFNDTDTA